MASTLEKMGTPPQTVEEISDFAARQRKLRFTQVKLLKASDSSRAAVMASPDQIDISAPDKDDSINTMGISVIGKTGTVMRGKVGFTGNPSDIRIAGLWKFNDLLLSAMPSTIMTPISVLKFSLPLESVKDFISTAASIGAVAGIV